MIDRATLLLALPGFRVLNVTLKPQTSLSSDPFTVEIYASASW